MKRTIICGLVAILLGYIIGNIIFTKRDFIIKKNNNDKYYLLQEGIYYDKNILKNINAKSKIVEKTKDKIYIYVGITKNIEVAERLVNIYEKDNIKLSIIEKYLSNEELKNNIEQFDFLILSSIESKIFSFSLPFFNVSNNSIIVPFFILFSLRVWNLIIL